MREKIVESFIDLGFLHNDKFRQRKLNGLKVQKQFEKFFSHKFNIFLFVGVWLTRVLTRELNRVQAGSIQMRSNSVPSYSHSFLTNKIIIRPPLSFSPWIHLFFMATTKKVNIRLSWRFQSQQNTPRSTKNEWLTKTKTTLWLCLIEKGKSEGLSKQVVRALLNIPE